VTLARRASRLDFSRPLTFVVRFAVTFGLTAVGGVVTFVFAVLYGLWTWT